MLRRSPTQRKRQCTEPDLSGHRQTKQACHRQSIIVHQSPDHRRSTDVAFHNSFSALQARRRKRIRNKKCFWIELQKFSWRDMMRVLIRRTIKLKAEAAGFLLFSSIEGFNKEESGPAQPRMIREFSQSKSVGHVRRQPSNKMTKADTHTQI